LILNILLIVLQNSYVWKIENCIFLVKKVGTIGNALYGIKRLEIAGFEGRTAYTFQIFFFF